MRIEVLSISQLSSTFFCDINEIILILMRKLSAIYLLGNVNILLFLSLKHAEIKLNGELILIRIQINKKIHIQINYFGKKRNYFHSIICTLFRTSVFD